MKKLTIYLFFLAALVVRCSGDLPLSDLVNNTITLKVMGTYESNNPNGLIHAGIGNALPVDDVITAGFITSSPTIAVGSNLDNYINSNAADATDSTGFFPQWRLHADKVRYYIDIAEIRLAEGQGKSSSQSISDYWSQFAISRQLMCSDYNTADNRTLSNCQGSSGIERLQQFFNGGFTYPAADVATGNYNHMGIYFRRFATYPAAFFTGEGKYGGVAVNENGTWGSGGTRKTAEETASTVFDNRAIYGQDIEGFLQNPYGQTAAEPLMFPLQRKDLSLRITNGAEPYVMEVRIFLQNLMMVHVRQVSNNAAVANSSSNGTAVYVAPSDWNADHVFLETDGSGNSGKHGGAVVMTARVYQPASVGRIIMGGTFSPITHESYFVAVSADSTVNLATTMPLVATPSSNNTLSNLAPGTYKVYRTCDLLKCGSTSGGTCTAITGTDGFPETYAACNNGATVTVTKGTDSNVTTVGCTTAGTLAGCT